MGEQATVVRRDKCAELGDSLRWYKWEPHEQQFIEKIKDMTFEYLGASDSHRITEMLEELHGSH